MRWTRTNKADLARRIAEYLGQDLSGAEIARRIGKTRARVCQIVKLFSLRDPRNRALILSGKVSPQET